jgi:HlyD family secretion protein
MQLIPGMGLTAELKVGRRRVISYFLYPLLRGLDESIREY